MEALPDGSRADPAQPGRTVAWGVRRQASKAEPPEDALPARVALCLHRMCPDADGDPAHSDLPHDPHDPRDHVDHIDLFIGPCSTAAGSDDDTRIAHSWRLPVTARNWRTELHATDTVRWPAIATPRHRALYLRLAHPRTLDGGRGVVEPLAAGDGWMWLRSGSLVAEVCLATVENDGAPTLLRVEVRDDAGGTTAEFRLLEPRESSMQDSR